MSDDRTPEPAPVGSQRRPAGEASAELRLGLPSKGRMEEATRRFLEVAGVPASRPNPRQYLGRIDGVPGITAVYQRAADIVAKVDEGSLDIGITGYDMVAEYRYDDDNLIVLMEDLGFARVKIVVAVPEGWIDVASMADLADLAVDFKSAGRELRIATEFPNLARTFLYKHGVNYFVLTGAHGALEAAPAMGYADLVVEITETGTTLRDNRLKLLDDGVILGSQACLVGNRAALKQSEEKRQLLRGLVEPIEARLRARDFRRITANIRGESEEAVARHVIAQVETAGEHGPTISRVYAKHAGHAEPWFAVSIVVPKTLLLKAVDHLRRAGSSAISVQTPEYLFDAESWAYKAIVHELDHGPTAR